MSCFCKDTVDTLADKMAKLAPKRQTATNQATDDPVTPAAQEPHQQQVAKLARWVQTRLPATPWQPDPAWGDHRVAACAARAGRHGNPRRAGAGADTDRAVPCHRPAAAGAGENVSPGRGHAERSHQALPATPDAAPWQKLASQATAVKQVEDAAAKDLFTVTPQTRQNAEQPGGVPLRQWRDLYQKVKDLAPLLAVARQLGVDLADPEAPARLAQKLRPLRSTTLPPLAAPFTMAQYTTLARALAEIADVLDVDPTDHDPKDLQHAIAQRQKAVLQGLQLQEDDPPVLPASVANLVTPAVVKALQAIRPQTLQAMQWKVPPSSDFPLVVTGLPAVAFIDTLRQTKVDAVRAAPCGQRCDAAAMLRQAEASS